MRIFYISIKLSICIKSSSLIETTGISDSLGSLTTIATAIAPPGLRTALGSVSNIANAEKNKKLGLVEIIADGSDYGWMCPCGEDFYQGKPPVGATSGKFDRTKCPGDQKIGCFKVNNETISSLPDLR
jgi:hypothetical protein